MKRALVILGVAAAVIGAALWFYEKSRPLDVHVDDIRSVEIQAYPEGPPGPVFSREPDPSGNFLSMELSSIQRFLPDPLPNTVWQGFRCEFGGNLIVTLQDGSTVRYGPCRRPASIDALWAHILDVFSEGACRPRCGPGSTPGS